MVDLSRLSRRERQIMEILYARREATVHEIIAELPSPPTPMAVRRMLAILLEKGHLKRSKRGREFVYAPRQSKRTAGAKAFRQVLATFFEGSVGEALATHLEQRGGEISDEELERLAQMIDELHQDRGAT
jgi:predicted transcriptional regulator